MSSPSYFGTLARYNAWANARLFAACAAVSDAERRKKRGTASMHSALTEVLAVDMLWFGRIEGKDYGITSLDVVLHDDFAELTAARTAFDRHIIDVVDTLKAETLEKILPYVNITGEAMEQPVLLILGHVFNRQTNLRGQVHEMLVLAGNTPASIDVIYYLLENKKG